MNQILIQTQLYHAEYILVEKDLCILRGEIAHLITKYRGVIGCKFEMVTLWWTNYISIDDTPITRGRSLVILVQCRLVTNRLYSNNRCSSADEDCDDPSTKAVREKERRQANNVRERLVNTRSKLSRCYFLRVLPFIQNPLFASCTLLSYACPKSNKRKKK